MGGLSVVPTSDVSLLAGALRNAWQVHRDAVSALHTGQDTTSDHLHCDVHVLALAPRSGAVRNRRDRYS